MGQLIIFGTKRLYTAEKEKLTFLKKNRQNKRLFFGNIKIIATFVFGRQFQTDQTGFWKTVITKVMATLKYTMKQINRNYKIKVSGLYNGEKVNTLVGVAGLVRMVGDIELTNRLLDRAFACMDDKCVCKLRRGIKVSFYVA